jgi:asparagine synthase (glutamine-hydrolysing)
MCGIAGFVGKAISEKLPVLKKMTDVIAHRGPDDEGFYCDEEAALGFRRLSIIDVAGGHQPMCNEDETIWIIFNGEIYNYAVLREDLKRKGHRFKTHSDTEVVIHLYEEIGEACLNKFQGMFAFALWDKRKKQLFLARDRVGIKPLYYSLFQNALIFGSEIKAILEYPGVSRKTDPTAIDSYMSFLWTPEPKTIFKNIFKLPSAHYLIFKNGRSDVRSYWNVTFEPDYATTEKAWKEKILQSLEEIVGKHLISEVPLGAFLSGGIDSTAIVGIMKQKLKFPVQTYTIAFKEEDLKRDVVQSDVEYARLAARHFHIDHREILLQPDVVGLLPRLIWHMDEPVADPAAMTTYLICKAAKETLTVLLSGVGGDEIFAGYPRYPAVKVAEWYNRIPAFLRENMLNRLINSLPSSRASAFRNAKKLIRSSSLPFIERYMGYRTYYTEKEKSELYTADFQNTLRAVHSDPLEEHLSYLEEVSNNDMVSRMLYVDLKTFLPSLNLMYTDKMSMASSVEVRVPFLDHTLIELAAKIPSDMKLRNFKRKYIFKKSMEGFLPHSIIWRKKAGFGAPLRSWITNDLKEMVYDLLSEKRIRERGYFNYGYVQKMLKEEFSGKEYYSNHIWQLLTLELWHQIFYDRGAQFENSRSPLTKEIVTSIQ